MISHLALLRATVNLATRLEPGSQPILYIPQIVLAELDGLKVSTRETDYANCGEESAAGKTRTSISILARAAITWLLEALSTSGAAVVRGQKRSETLVPTPDGRPPLGENNDSLVLDAALWCRQHLAPQRIALITEDRNLRIRATVEGLETLIIEPHEGATGLLARLKAGSVTGPQVARRTKSRHAPSAPTRVAKTDRMSERMNERRLSAAQSGPEQKSASVARAPSTQLLDPPHPSPAPLDMEDTAKNAVDSYHPSSALPPLHADLPPPPLVSVETVADVFYNLALLTSHFIALPIYRHVYEDLVRTRPDERHVWLAALQDWRDWLPTTCIAQARRWWEDGDIEGLCRVGLACAYEAKAPTIYPDTAALPPTSAESTAANSASKVRTSRWATTSGVTRSQRRVEDVRPPAPASVKPTSGRKRAPQLAHIRRDLTLVQEFLGADPSAVASWPALRWEVLLETLGLFLVAVLGGTFKSDVRSEVSIIVQQAVSDLRVCGVAVHVEV